MADSYLLPISALLALLPATVYTVSRPQPRGALFWLLLGVAVAGPLVQTAVLFGTGWRTGLSAALWVTIATTMVLFAALAAASRRAWALSSLLLPYMTLLGLLAVIWHNQSGEVLHVVPSTWIQIHIVLSMVTYGLVTIAAVAALAVFLQERAIKSRSPGKVTGLLPSIADAEYIEVRLLSVSLVILACGVLTGMSAQYVEDGRLMVIDHKTVFTLVALVIIAALLVAHRVSGVRGRKASRILLVAYLFLTLAFPGVKFVTDIILA